MIRDTAKGQTQFERPDSRRLYCCGILTEDPTGTTGGRDWSGVKHQGIWTILTTKCAACGKMYAVEPEKLTTYQKAWIERRNKMVLNP